jgi:hypothetical protein
MLACAESRTAGRLVWPVRSGEAKQGQGFAPDPIKGGAFEIRLLGALV